MDNFNLHEWVGKGEKNLLNEARDDDDFLTTISPEEQGVDPADATVEEDQLDEVNIENYQVSRLLDDLARTKEFAKMKKEVGSAEKLDSLVKQSRRGVIEPLVQVLKMSGIVGTNEFRKLKNRLRSLNPDTSSLYSALMAIINYLRKEGKINRDIGSDDFDNFGLAEEDSLEEGQLNEGALDDLIKAIFGSAAKEAVKKKSEKEVKSLHKKIFGFDYKDRNSSKAAKDL